MSQNILKVFYLNFNLILLLHIQINHVTKYETSPIHFLLLYSYTYTLSIVVLVHLYTFSFRRNTDCMVVMDSFKTSLLILASYLTLAGAFKESYTAEYFTNVSLHCNYTLHNLTYPPFPDPIKKYWVLPNSTVLPDTFLGDSKFVIQKPEFILYVGDINEEDFGLYHCVLLWNNWDYHVDVIRIGLNEDGPYYEKLLRQLERNLIIGSVSAAVFFMICMFGCWYWNHKTKKKNEQHFDYLHDISRRNSKHEYSVTEERPPGELGMYAKVQKRGHDNPAMNKTSHDLSVQSAKM